MFGLLLRSFAILLVGILLTACGSRPKQAPDVQEVYQIRDVAVTANAGVPRALMRGIQIRMEKSIQGTVRPAPLPRAVMNIRIVNLSKTQGNDGLRTETEVSVTLTDVPSGQALQVRNFMIYSFSISPSQANDSAAEAIASRLRVEYALAQPAIRVVPVKSPRVSTRMTDDTLVPLNAKREKVQPVVIPLKTAPVIGVDQDPILNSKTKVAPAKQETAPVKDEAAVKAEADQPAANAIEDGAAVKVVIKPKATQPSADEPCVETMDKKC
jgi:hypothetical protein